MFFFLTGNNEPASIYKWSALKPAFDNMATGRTAFIGIGDSNQFKDGHGWDDGFPQALKRAGYNCYATPLHPGSENSYIGSGMGSISSQANNGGVTAWGKFTITNAYLNDYNLYHDANANSANMQFLEYFAAPAAGQNNGINVADAALSYIPGRTGFFNLQSSNLLCRMKYGTSAQGSGGQLDISTRLTYTPFTTLGTVAVVSCNTGVDSIQTHTRTINGATGIPAGNALQFSAHKVSGTNVTTPGYFGDSTTQFDITNPSGTTFRYTYDATGTDPGITSSNPPVGMSITIQAQNFAAGNKGTFTVTGSGANYFEVTNASGVAEINKTIGTGYITKGGAWVLYQEVIDENVTAGFRHTTLFGNGGQSSYDMALWWTTRTVNARCLYLQTIEETTNGGKVVIYIQTAANDTAETSASISSGATPGSSYAAYLDNMATLVQDIRSIWENDCGFAANRLHILLIPGHALGTALATEQENYYQACKVIADTYLNTAVLDCRKLFDNTAMLTNNFYTGPQTDKFHLEARGYATIPQYMLADIGKGTRRPLNPVSVADNGNAAYLLRTSAITGMADATSGTLMFTLYPAAAGSTITSGVIMQGRDVGGNIIFNLDISSSRPRLQLYNTSGAARQVLLHSSSSGLNPLYNDTRHHFIMTWNTVGSLYQGLHDEASYMTSATITASGTVALGSITQWSLFADTTGANKYDGGIGDVWFLPGTYVDFTVEANRRAFINPNGEPMTLGADGATTIGTPKIFMTGANMATGTNGAGTGDFTVTGGSFTVTNIKG